jgi:hypothetical protein
MIMAKLPISKTISSCTTPVFTGLVRSNSGSTETSILSTSKVSTKTNMWEERTKTARSKEWALSSTILTIKLWLLITNTANQLGGLKLI